MLRIEDLLSDVPEGQRHLRFSFGHGDDGYVARAMLTLPTGHLVARTATPVSNPGAAVDQVVDQLAAEVWLHRSAVRNDGDAGDGRGRVGARRRRRQRDFAAAGPHLAAARRSDDRDGFFDMLRPLLRQLRDHARRELILAQLEGTFPPAQLTVGDLLDELLLRAWDRWDRRPGNEPPDHWLVRLLHEALDERGLRLPDDAPGEVHQDGPYAVENGWAVDNNPYWPFTDSLTLEDVVPATDSAEPWARLAEEEQRRLILDALKQFHRHRRRAFVLHVLEGWPVKDIAAASKRAPERVIEDVEAVRKALRERLAKQAN